MSRSAQRQDHSGGAASRPTAEIQLEDGLALPKLLDGLPELERRAVILRYYGDFKQHEIGAMLGYSQMHVSRLLRRALSQMRTQLAARPVDPMETLLSSAQATDLVALLAVVSVHAHLGRPSLSSSSCSLSGFGDLAR